LEDDTPAELPKEQSQLSQQSEATRIAALERAPARIALERSKTRDRVEQMCRAKSQKNLKRMVSILTAGKQATDFVAEDVVRRALATLDEEGGRVGEASEVFREGCPEHKWLSTSIAKRMLRATKGNEDEAVRMLIHGVELRMHRRSLLQCMRCEPKVDMRIVGSDLEGHPTVFGWVGSQTDPLRELVDQVVLTFEAATRMAPEGGSINLLADMHGANMKLNMDLHALKECADILGTVYAECLNMVIVIDFSWAAQLCWSMLKPLLAEATQKKLAFVSAAEARQMCTSMFDESVCQRICETFDLDRDPQATPEARQAYCRATAEGDFPYGAED